MDNENQLIQQLRGDRRIVNNKKTILFTNPRVSHLHNLLSSQKEIGRMRGHHSL